MRQDRLIWLVSGTVLLYLTYRFVLRPTGSREGMRTIQLDVPPPPAAPAPAPAPTPATASSAPLAASEGPIDPPVRPNRPIDPPRKSGKPKARSGGAANAPPPPPPPLPSPTVPSTEPAADCEDARACGVARASRVSYDLANSGYLRPANSEPRPFRALHISILLSDDTPSVDADMTLYRSLASGINKGTYKLNFIQIDAGSDHGLSDTLKEQCRDPVLKIPVFSCTTGYCAPSDMYVLRDADLPICRSDDLPL